MTTPTLRFLLAGFIAGALVTSGSSLSAQGGGATQGQTASVAPTNSSPNPYETVENYFKLPDGRVWGSTSAVDVDKDGKSIWVAERCGVRTTTDAAGQSVTRATNSCWDAQAAKFSTLDPIMKFDASGKLVRSFGQGMFVFPHGIHVDRDGNIWITDGSDNLPRRARGATADPPMPSKVVGHQIFKFSPEGKVLLTLGKPGGNQPGQPADPASFYQPNDIITNAAGDIFVCEGHSSNATAGARIVKFDKTGKFIKEWGKRGTAPGEFDQPHAFAFDSKGRLFIADRSNNRIQIFDQDGTLLDSGWQQYSRISGLWIDKDDTLYAADSESGSVSPPHGDWTRGIRIGSVKDGPNGQVKFFIPDPEKDPRAKGLSTSSAEGIAVDAAGNIYGAEVGQAAIKKYVKK
jgi:sugar lactone lactonase YvrE